MIRFLLLLALVLSFNNSYGQLGFCNGSKGDPIFQEDFGTGSGYGPRLAAGITNYSYVTQDPQDGEYTISSIIGREIPSWHSYSPNLTPSGGKALIINAGFTAGQFYRTDISGLCENTTYEFSAYLMNIYNSASGACADGDIPVNVKFQIWDETDTQLLKEGSTGAINSTAFPLAEEYALTFKSAPGQNNVILKMFNNGEGGCGNDLAIDDIIFRSCGDLTSIDAGNSSNMNLRVCEEDTPYNVDLKATPDNTVYQTHAYQWQRSLDAVNWTDISGANQSNYTVVNLVQSTYYRVKVAEDSINLTNNLCSSFSEAFFVQMVSVPTAPVSNGDVVVCGNSEIPQISVKAGVDEMVNWYDAPSGGNLLQAKSFNYQPDVAGIFYAEAKSTLIECKPSSRTIVKITLDNIPDVEDETIQICPNSNISLDAGVSGFNYMWSTGENSQTIQVTQQGNYTVEIATNLGCAVTREFTVNDIDDAQISDVRTDENSIEIIPVNIGVFEYSLDGVNFQDSNVFLGKPGGVYTAYMRDKSGCNTVSLQFPYISPLKFITPNGDGYNDNFILRGVETFPSSQIMIYDRYGKLLKAGNGSNFSWNGTLEGKDLPAADYWYHIKIEGFGELKGHFSLIR